MTSAVAATETPQNRSRRYPSVRLGGEACGLRRGLGGRVRDAVVEVRDGFRAGVDGLERLRVQRRVPAGQAQALGGDVPEGPLTTKSRLKGRL
jgi:hypothetical protein